MADAFQPKFVDLVRNFTDTVGTGNLVLGEAAAGFRSFSSALQPGDSFYYSVAGLERTNESEVGRGTLQADGTISREPVGGVPTNFSTGIKTVALVAAAEWFQSIEAIRTAPARVGTRSELANIPPAGSALLTEAGREGLFVFDDSNLSARVTADAGQGVHVAPSSDPTGASGAWVRQFTGAINAQWFGLKDNDEADELANVTNLKAFNWAVYLAIVTGRRHVLVPPGTWYVYAVNKNRWAGIPAYDTAGPARCIWIEPGVDGEFTLEFAPGARIVRVNVPVDDAGTPWVDNPELADSGIVKVRLDNGSSIRVINPDIDGNETNFAYDAGQPSLYEQAANLSIRHNSDTTKKARRIVVENFHSRRAVGDGLQIACLADECIVDGVFSDDRTRRLRSDVTFSLLPDDTYLDNINVDALEFEPVEPNDDARVQLGRVLVRYKLDINGQKTSQKYLRINGGPLSYLGQHNGVVRSNLHLLQLKGTIQLGELHTYGDDVGTTDNKIRDCQIKFVGGEVVIEGRPSTSTAASELYFYPEFDGNSVEFIGTRFITGPGVTTGSAFTSSSTNTSTRTLRLTNCSSDGGLQYIFACNRPGTIIAAGGDLKASVAIVCPSSGSGSTQHIHLSNMDAWQAPALIDGANAMNGTARIFLSGVFNGEYSAGEPGMVLASTLDPTYGTAVTWNVDATMMVTSSPASRLIGVPGLRAQLTEPSSGDYGWIYRDGARAGNDGWVAETDFQPLDDELSALAGVTSAADKVPYFTGSGTASVADFTAAGRALVDDADASAQRATLGLGTIATQSAENVSISGGSISGIADLAIEDGGTGASTAADARTNLGLAAIAASGDASDLTGTLDAAHLPSNQKLRTITFVIDGGGSAITAGAKGFLEIPFACTIQQVTMLADQPGSIAVDIWRDTYANHPPTDAVSITASAVPTISAASKSQDSTLTGWTTSISAGDILGFHVDSASTVKSLTLALQVSVS